MKLSFSTAMPRSLALTTEGCSSAVGQRNGFTGDQPGACLGLESRPGLPLHSEGSNIRFPTNPTGKCSGRPVLLFAISNWCPVRPASGECLPRHRIRRSRARWGEAMAGEIAPFGIGVTVLITGAYDTDIIADAGTTDCRDFEGRTLATIAGSTGAGVIWCGVQPVRRNDSPPACPPHWRATRRSLAVRSVPMLECRCSATGCCRPRQCIR